MTGRILEPLNRHGMLDAEQVGPIAPLDELGGEGLGLEVEGVGHLPPAAAAEHRVVEASFTPPDKQTCQDKQTLQSHERFL